MAARLLRAESGAAARPVAWPPAEGGRRGEAPPPAQPAPPGQTARDAAQAAERQLADARAAAERQAREARQAGYREGEAAGRRAAEAELRPVIERLARSIEEIAALRPSLTAQAEASLLRLSVAIARRILHREISLDPDALAGVVRAALERVPWEDVSRVRVHPEQAAALRTALEKGAAAGRAIRVEPDGSLDRGAAVVDTGRGRLDASVETQLAEIERGLADRLRRSS